MSEPGRSAVTLTELRLATGTAAELIEHLPTAPEGFQFFTARAVDAPDRGATRIVVVHPPPPRGATSGILLDRMASIRAASHPDLAAPMAIGEVNGRGWIVEPLAPSPSLADRVRTRGHLSTSELLSVFRGLTRALAALHRTGVAHGALSLECITLDQQRVTVYHLGRTSSTDTARDWKTIGTLLSGVIRQDQSARHPPPPLLLTLLSRLADSHESDPPPSPMEILGILDRFPPGRTTEEHRIMEGVGRGHRSHRDRRTLILGAIAGVLVVVWFLLRGW